MTQINALYQSDYDKPIIQPETLSLERQHFVTERDYRYRRYNTALLLQVVPNPEPLGPHGMDIAQYFFPKVGIHRQDLTDWSAEKLRTDWNLSYARISELLGFSGESGARMAVNRYRARTFGVMQGYSYQIGSGIAPKTNMKTRRFGVEIEFVDLDFYEAARIVQMVTGRHCHTTSYHGRTCDTCRQRLDYSEWKIERDSTVTRTDTDDDGNDFTSGGEAISPVGFGEDHLAVIGKVMQGLRAGGAKVNTQAGLHVHLNMKDMGREGLANFVLTWAQQEDFMYGLCAPSRRGNHYCEPISITEAENIATQFRQSGRAYGNRGALNITSYPKLGTFEIRMHQGTLNPKKMTAWVKLLMALVQVVKQNEFSDLTGDLSVLGKLTTKGFLDQEIGSYLFARHGHFDN